MKNWNDICLLPLELASYGCHVYDQMDNLTGTGAHNLAEDEAATIQDTFAAWIIEKLTKTE